MPEFTFSGQFLSGIDSFDWGISSLLSVEQDGVRHLLVATGQDGGLATYGLGANTSLPSLSDTLELDVEINTGVGRPLSVAAAPDGLWVMSGQAGATLVSLSSSGALAEAGPLSGAASGASWFAQAGTSLVTGQIGANEVTLYEWDPNGTVSAPTALSDTAETHLRGLSTLATAEFGGVSYLFTASAAEYGLSAFTLQDGAASHIGSLGAASGIGLMAPTDIAFVDLNGQGFVLLTTAPGTGQSGTLTVMQLSPSGALTPVDHILDTHETRFGKAQAVETVVVNGQAFAVVAGGDGGLSLFQLAPDGQLIHLHSYEGTAQTPLLGLTGLALSLSGTTLQIFASTSGDAGVSMFTVDLGARGTPQIAAPAGQSLLGTAQHDLLKGGVGDDTLLGGMGDDILISGGGADSLAGGSGADTFVLTGSQHAAHIADFDQTEDTIDLSDWPFLYDPASLDIVLSNGSATLSWRDQSVSLTAASGSSFSLEGLLAAIRIDINRSFAMPQSDLRGTAESEVLTGSWGTDTLFGGAGDDTLAGGAGDDTLDGGTGYDTALIDADFVSTTVATTAAGLLQIASAQGTDSFTNIELFSFNDRTLTFAELTALMPLELYGSTASERLEGGDMDDLVAGGGGNDTLLGSAGDDTLDGGAGDDELFGGEGNDRLLGDAGNDVLNGDTGNDTLHGGAGNDQLNAGTGDDSLFGEAGDDTLVASQGNNFLSGGEGNDSLTAGEGRDTLAGGTGHDTLRGGAGEDSLSGDAGDDLLYGQDGNDTLYGDAGDDSLTGGAGDDRLYGGEGNDLLVDTSGQNILMGDAGDDSLVSGSQDDTLFGGSGHDTLKAGSGNDWLDGGADNDWLWGDAGDDSLLGGDGHDTLWGNGGDDTLDGEAGDDRLYGNAGDDILRGGDGDDTLFGGKSDDTLFGGDGNDILKGQKGDDFVSAGAGNDVARGNKGSDILFGEAGDDLLVGGGGDDTLHGGTGEDTVKGGGGDDVFVFQKGDGKDVFRSFGKGDDSLLIDSTLWGNATSPHDLIREYGTATNRGVIFDFGDGDRVILAGYQDLWGLADDIFMG